MKKLILALLILTPCVAWGATFGLTADNSGGSFTQLTQNQDNLNKFTLSEDGTVTSISAWLYGNNVAWKGVIYDDDGGDTGIPGTLMGVTAAGTTSTTAQFCTASFATGVELTAGTWWIGIVSNGAIYNYENSGGANNTYAPCMDSNYANPPTTAEYRNYFQDGYTMNVYATYTAGGGGGGGTPPAYPQILIFGKGKVDTIIAKNFWSFNGIKEIIL